MCGAGRGEGDGGRNKELRRRRSEEAVVAHQGRVARGGGSGNGVVDGKGRE